MCRKGFLNILGIKKGRLDTALKSATATATPTTEKRGKHSQSRKIVGTQAKYVHDHIMRFPMVSSHYTRAKFPSLRYLDGNLNINKMYRMYVSWMSSEHPDDPVVKESYYRMVFSTQYHLSFKPPKTDICSKCDEFTTSITLATEQRKKDDKKLF